VVVFFYSRQIPWTSYVVLETICVNENQRSHETN